MALHILYFAWVREKTGVSEEWLDLPTDVMTLTDLARWLSARGGGYEDAFADPTRLRCAIDQQIARLDAVIGNATEIAFFPPVTGG